MNDDTLLDIASAEILSCHRAGKPFNVTIMTTDNHAQSGFLSPRCHTSDARPQIFRVIECTNHTIAGFMRELEAEDVLNNIVLVVMGDHLFMKNKFWSNKSFGADKRWVFSIT